ncbi:hypothetical protein ACP70R_050099 [Stipagrostis hirtigluma subsp. patula]
MKADLENAICHNESNVRVETHKAIFHLLIKDEGDYFTILRAKIRKLKISLVTWAEYVCDFRPQWRSIPTAFKLFTGSAWMALSRPFVEYCVRGWGNLPRTVLMYYSNSISPEGYFHTVVCNAGEFKNTTVNHDLHYISWDNPPKHHLHYLTMDDLDRMVTSDAPFARKFHADEPVLDKIDQEILFRGPDMPTPEAGVRGRGRTGATPAWSWETAASFSRAVELCGCRG